MKRYTSQFVFGTIWLILLFSSPTLAQKQPSVNNIRVEVDTLGKRVRFTYDLLRAAPDDSLYVQVRTPDDNVFYLKTVQGDIGTNLTPGPNRTFFWSPLTDGRKLDGNVTITFMIRTYAADTLLGRRKGLLLTKQQLITYGRWGASAVLTGILIARSVRLISDIRAYNTAEPPINAAEKVLTDQQRAALLTQRRQLTPWVAAAGVSILGNVIYSLVQKKRPARKPPRLSWQGNGPSARLTYTF